MLSPGIFRHVAPAITDVSKDSIASTIMVPRIDELGTLVVSAARYW
jgi:hypothetical protein